MMYNIKVSSTFSKVVGLGQSPKVLFAVIKRRKGKKNSPVDCFSWGNPRRGFPLFVRREDGPCLRL